MTVDSDQRLPFEEIAEEFAERYRRGEAPSVEDYAARHPELAGRIRELFPVVQLAEDAGRIAAAGESSPVGRSISHYRIERQLGAGGMGRVYLATDVALGRPAALKILPDSFTPTLRDRLFREAWASARLQHPAIATFYEAGEADGVAFVAMEYVAGRTLHEQLVGGPIAFDRAVTLICCILEALAHAHAAEILHRDIKPANIMCTGGGAAKLLDFGLAKHAVMDSGESALQVQEVSDLNSPDSGVTAETETIIWTDGAPWEQRREDTQTDLTQAGTILGTIGYMSPEQLSGAPVDARTDIFAVGAVLYETLTGRPAFPGESRRQRMDAILHHDPPPIALADHSDEINSVLSRALAKDSSQRFCTAGEFLRELRAMSAEQVKAALPNAIGVLDFERQSDDDRLEWLSAALPDALTDQLQVRGMTTVPRVKVAAVQQSVIGNSMQLGLHLGCRWVISGQFRGTRERIEVSAQLIDVPGSMIRDRCEARGATGNLLEIQPSILDNLMYSVSAAAPPLEGSQNGPSAEAYECYVLGRRELLKYEKAAFENAFHLFQRAVTLSPHYALALSGLAQIAGMRFPYDNDAQTLISAIEYAQRAIHCDPQLADPWVWLGYARCQQIFGEVNAGRESKAAATLASSESAMARALKLDETHPVAAYFAAGFAQLGCRFTADSDDRTVRRERAAALYQRALKVTPHSCWAWLGLGFAHLDLGHHPEARWCLQRAVELEPQVTPPTAGVAVFQAECLRRIGELRSAREACLQGLDIVEKTDHMYRDTFRGVGLCVLGRVLLQLGDREAARAAFRQAELHLRGRMRARIGGQLLVQALAGLTRCGEGPEPFEEAVALFEARRHYEFGWLWWGWDEITLLQLSLAAAALGRTSAARPFLKAALDAGSVEAESIAASVRVAE
jgi:serine/threonine protein kinase/tetratricopeptide (TPR) repeat protein